MVLKQFWIFIIIMICKDILDNDDIEISSGFVVIPEKLALSFILFSVIISLTIWYNILRK
jgi:hypothetical protein